MMQDAHTKSEVSKVAEDDEVIRPETDNLARSDRLNITEKPPVEGIEIPVTEPVNPKAKTDVLDAVSDRDAVIDREPVIDEETDTENETVIEAELDETVAAPATEAEVEAQKAAEEEAEEEGSDVFIEDIYPDPDPELLPKEPRILAMINQKGGVGKTTTTANLGAALINQGFSVLLIDLDPQAHLTLHVGLDPENLEGSAYDLITNDDTAAADVVYQLNSHLSIIPSEVNLAGAESELAGAMASGKAQRALKSKLTSVISGAAGDRPFDYILLDCPPSLGLLTINALSFANEVVVPMQAHFLALQGLSKLLETISLIRECFNPALELTGVILCMHEGQTILAQEVMNDLSGFFEANEGTDTPWSRTKIHTPAIRRNIKLAESPSFGKTIFDYAPYSNGARDYEKLASSVAEQVLCK